jgi:hypothetical protein
MGAAGTTTGANGGLAPGVEPRDANNTAAPDTLEAVGVGNTDGDGRRLREDRVEPASDTSVEIGNERVEALVMSGQISIVFLVDTLK